MYFDTVIVAGLLVVIATVGVVGGFATFMIRDAKKSQH